MLPDDWRRVRAVRLRALRDAPDAFGMTLAEGQAKSIGGWRKRLEDPNSTTFVATTTEGEDVGIVVGCPYNGQIGAAGLFSMWVAPEFRGSGVGGGLIDALIAWARADSQITRILLDVGDHNIDAIRLYESRNFLPTGATGTLPPPREAILEHQRELVL